MDCIQRGLERYPVKLLSASHLRLETQTTQDRKGEWTSGDVDTCSAIYLFDQELHPYPNILCLTGLLVRFRPFWL